MINLALVGPVAPFRGGIARHSTALARAFAARSDVELQVESFARLYPGLLYPGTTDRDETAAIEPPAGTYYNLDTLNPLTFRAAIDRIVERRCEIAILPAWTFFVAPALGWIARSLRRHGVTVVTIVHNATDHERSGWKFRLLNWQLATADGFIAHTNELTQELQAAGHCQPVVVSPHPAYSDFPAARGPRSREHALELLCFGLVRRYKGVDVALRSLAAAGLDNVRLTIAGEVWEDAAKLSALIESPALHGKVELIDRYVSDAEAAELFDRCDAVLAPYRSVTGSGVAALARHYCRPVIAPDLPGFRETIEHGRTGWLFPAGDEDALAEILRKEVTRESASTMEADLERARGEGGWQRYCQSILELGGRLRQSHGGGA